LLLVAAVILSAVIGERSDVVIISFILLATGLLSFIQERHAGRTIEKLQSLLAIKAMVLRDQQEVEVPAHTLVTGDVLLVNAGDIVPADCYLLEANELHVNEAGLTGESFPVKKNPAVLAAGTVLGSRYNCLWEGSSVVSGMGKAIVVHTGTGTVFGGLVKSVTGNGETAYEKGLRHFGYFLMQITLVLAIVILAVNLLFHRPVVESLLFALALAVGMAPELLPAINTIAMSAGARRLLKQKVIVKKLSAIQNLGEVNLLCTDKTGTLTQGNIEVADTCNPVAEHSNFVRELAFLNGSLATGYTNPVDDALKKLPMTLAANIIKLGEIPYDFLRKRLTVAVAENNQCRLITKGAFKQVLEICTQVRLDEETIVPLSDYRQVIGDLYTRFGNDGYRVLGVCYRHTGMQPVCKEDEQQMIFAGFILLHDPVKEGIQDALQALKELKVEVKIITGDNQIIARSVARKIGIPEPVIITGEELQQMSSEALAARALATTIFAEVEPFQKERIIRALRKNYTVAYMGDGINDVGAMHAADVGISIDNAVDAAKMAASFVMLERNLLVLADGIREGRKTLINTMKYIFITTGATFGNMFSMACASLLLPFLPMLPGQILLTNFLTDLPFLAVSTDLVDTEELQKSGRWNIKLIRRYMITFGLHSSIFDVLVFTMLYYLLKAGETAFQTAWFTESVLTELLIIFIIRTRRSFIKSRPGKVLLVLSAAACLITITLPYWPIARPLGMVPLPPLIASAVGGIVLLYVLTADLLKKWFFKKMRG
jgi:P-type Mg2+ transporter